MLPAWIEGMITVVLVVLVGAVLVMGLNPRPTACDQAEAQMESMAQCSGIRGCTFPIERLEETKRLVAQCAVQRAP